MCVSRLLDHALAALHAPHFGQFLLRDLALVGKLHERSVLGDVGAGTHQAVLVRKHVPGHVEVARVLHAVTHAIRSVWFSMLYAGELNGMTSYDIKIGGVTHVKVSLNSFYYSLIEKNFNSGQLQSITQYLKKNDISLEHKGFYLENLSHVVDYYNSNHIDYRGLIEKNLAIEITEDNNPYKN